MGEFELTAWGPFGGKLYGEEGFVTGKRIVPMVTYDEPTLRQAIADGTLKPGCFDACRCNSSAGPYVSNWPEWAQPLKQTYGPHDSYNEPWPDEDMPPEPKSIAEPPWLETLLEPAPDYPPEEAELALGSPFGANRAIVCYTCPLAGQCAALRRAGA